MRKLWFLLLLMGLTAVSGCTFLPAETGVVPTATAAGDMLTYSIPAYSISMNPGSSINGAPMRYLSHNREVYTMEIDGVPIDKRAGDSFDWQGLVAPGVYANYNLHLTTAVFDALPVAGTVEYLIFNPNPRDLPLPANHTDYIALDWIVADYLAPVGREIPGTVIIYEGVGTKGQGTFSEPAAKLVSPLNTRLLLKGDSFTAVSAVRENAYIEYSLRVLDFDEDSLHLFGTAKLWVDPTPKP